MLQDFNKIVKQNKLLLILIMVFWIINYSALISKFSFAKLPLLFTLIFIVSLLLLYVFFNNHQKISKLLKNQNQSPASNKDSKYQDAEDEKIHVDNNDKAFHENLLKGITKKTTKKVFAEKFLSNLVKNQEAEVGLFYLYNKKAKTYQAAATYAYLSEEKPTEFKSGEGINGQVVKNKKPMRINDVAETHLKVVSGLGEGKPLHIYIYPVVINNEVLGVLELGSFNKISNTLDEELTKFFEANSDNFLNIEDK